MDFIINKNEFGYYGIIDKDKNEEIVPFVFKERDVLNKIEFIEKRNDNYYVLHIKNENINGWFDKKIGVMAIPKLEYDYEYFYIKDLEEKNVKNIKITNELTIAKTGKYYNAIHYQTEDFFIDNSFSDEIDDYELIDDKALLLKSHGKIVNVFDLKDKVFLKIEDLVNKNVLLFSRTKNTNRDIEYVSIVDLKNKKYLKDIFTFEWHYKEVVDARSPYYNEAREEFPVIASHSERVCNGKVNINNNVIEFVNEKKCKKNIIIYDINTGELINNIKIMIKKINYI